MADENTIPQLLLEIFGSARNDIYAAASYENNAVAYRLVKGSLTEDLIRRHLAGEITLGTYHLSPENMVRWLGWDIDTQDAEEAKRMVLALREKLQSLPHAVEVSGGKGYHVLVFLEEPVPAAQAKEFTEHIRSAAGLAASGASHCECYPKQGAVTAQSPFGSLLKLPLGLHPRTRTRSHFVDPDAGWVEVDALTMLLTRVSALQIMLVTPPSTPGDRIAEIMVSFWGEGQRHNLALGIAGFLGTLGWSLEAACDIVSRICEWSGDAEIENRLRSVHDTYRKIEQKETVAGYTILADTLPSNALHALLEIASIQAGDVGVRRIDEIRMRREATFLKVRLAESTIFADLRDVGRWIRSEDGFGGYSLYYFDNSAHRLYPVVQRPNFDSSLLQLLHRKYGLNVAESFGRQTYDGLLTRAAECSDLAKVHRRNYWDGDKLFSSLGGTKVYVLDGTTIQQSWNGDCGHIFETTLDPVCDVPLNQEPRKVAWSLLVEDLNLVSSVHAPATPAEQRALVWAWSLNTYFPSIAQTKPLLCALGPAASGKTTALRRIARVLEGWNTDVLELNTDKQDSLRASFANHHILVIDNLEKSGSKWLADMLNRICTGSTIELRQLYTTNNTYSIRPQCFVAMTAVSLPFSEETVFSRMLFLEFQQLRKIVPEHVIQAKLLENYGDVWLDIFTDLNKVVKVLQNGYLKTVPDATTRLADFEMFCGVVQEAGICKEDLVGGLKAIPKQQQNALADSSPFVSVLQMWIDASPEDAVQPHSAGDLLNILQPLAKSTGDKRWLWSTPHGLARHIDVLEPQLADNFGCKIEEQYDTRQGRTLKKYKFRKG